MVSFCITCMGRLNHLKQTLFSNIEIARSVIPDVEFVLLNYGNTPDLNQFIESNAYLQYLTYKKQLVYLQADAPFYREAHSKNIAHYFSSRDIVVNLDADNFLSEDYCNQVKCLHSSQMLTTQLRTGGAAGRIAMHRKIFFKLGGYDEQRPNIVTRCFIDSDLKIRACFSGIIPIIYDCKKISVIEHDNKLRSVNFEKPLTSYTDDLITDFTGPRQTFERILKNELTITSFTKTIVRAREGERVYPGII